MGVLALGYANVAVAQTATTPPEDGTRLERITVTAERRLTVLDDTPAAITALNGSKLADQGVTKIEDIVMLAPNTNFTTGQGASQLFIRGIGNVFILAGGDPGVAMYTDGAYISDQYSSNLALFDTQRVEVLRGPQGALYGRNATGGAMNIISARPTAAWDSRVGLLFGNYNRREVEGHVSGPVGGGTSLRFSFQAKEADGYTRNPLAGQTGAPVVPGLAPTTGPDRLDDTSSRAFRLQSSSDFGAGNLRLIAGRYREDGAGPSSAVLIDPIMISQLLFNALPSTDPRVVKSHDSTLKIDVDTFQAIYEHTMGANTLSLTASWRKSKTFHRYDGDVTEGPAVATQFLTEGKDRMVDLHVASETGVPFQWLVGATALRFDQTQDVRVSAAGAAGILMPGLPLDVPFPGGVDILLGGKVRTKSVSAYADLRYAFSPSLALLAGIRANKDEKSADEYQDIAAFGLVGRGTLSDSWRSTPGSVGLEYRVSPETLTYAKVSTGFKSGAVNLGSLQSAMVKPERVTAEEIGVKTDFLERRGTLNVAVFNSDYRDMQVSRWGRPR
jgi:outer membrane receptor protein involved in Fe transport